MKIRVRTYLALTFIFASVMPLAVFWSWPYSRILNSEMAQAQERHLLVAQNLASAMGDYHSDLVTLLRAFREVIASGGRTESQILFEQLHFRHVCVADAESGRVSVAYLAKAHACPSVVPAERLAFLRGLADSAEIGISSVVRSAGEKPRIYLSTRSGPSIVIGAIHMDFFHNLSRQVRFGENGHAALFDGEGQVLSHPLRTDDGPDPDLSSLPPVRRLLQGDSGNEIFHSPLAQEEMVGGFVSVPSTGWGVVVSQPLRELEDAAAQFNRDAIVILSIGVLFSLAIALAVSLQFSRRLGHIATALHRVAQEQDDVTVEPSRDLIGIRELVTLQDDVDRLAKDSAAARAAQSAHSRSLELANEKLRQEMADRQMAESARESSEIRFKSLFESAPIPIREEDLSGMMRMIDALDLPDLEAFDAYIAEHPEFLQACGREIVVVDANRASIALHGYDTKEQMLARVVHTLSPAAMKIVQMTARALFSGARGRSYETNIRRKDGTVRTVAATWSVIPGHEDTYARILLSSVDLTERLRSEAALRQAQKMEAVGQLTGGVAHDFNNLLTVIGGNLDLLDSKETLDTDLVDPIQKAVERGAELTQRLLAFSRKQPLMPQPINLNDLVVGMTGLLRRSLGEEIAIEIASEASLWLALADPGQVEAALLNMALNSRDAMPDGGVLTLSSRNVVVGPDDAPDVPPGDYVMLIVSDTGTGMPEDVASRAFEPFFTTKEVGKGSGLGLSMVYGFAKQSNGDVLIDSATGRGTAMSLYLPRTMDVQTMAKPQKRGSVRFLGEGQAILVLEDDPDVRCYLLKLLSSFGYRGIPAEDVRAAKRILDSGQPIDLLISDIMLPGGVRGPEFAADLVARLPETQVIFISGRPTKAEIPEVAGLAEAAVLTKPFSREELLQKIQLALKVR